MNEAFRVYRVSKSLYRMGWMCVRGGNVELLYFQPQTGELQTLGGKDVETAQGSTKEEIIFAILQYLEAKDVSANIRSLRALSRFPSNDMRGWTCVWFAEHGAIRAYLKEGDVFMVLGDGDASKMDHVTITDPDDRFHIFHETTVAAEI